MKPSGLFELNAVISVSIHRSFRKAAAELGMSPSSLSHAIAELEKRLGVRLFQRTTRSVSLSEAGQEFVMHVQPALRQISMAMESVNRFRDTPTGTLRISTSERAARMVLEPIILKFLQHYPDMKLELVTEGRLVDIVAQGFDAGIRLAEAVPQDMIAVPCSPPLQFAVVGSPAYFQDRSKPVAPADLFTHRCIRSRMPSGAIFRWEFERRGEQIALDVEGALTLDNHNVMRDAALSGLGLAYMTQWLVQADLAQGRLIRVLQDWTPSFPGLCVYYPGHRQVPAGLRAFISLVREATSPQALAG
ncbi:MAG: lysR [Polaromonas sp.]|nr:lysR [Polaromonas sp.]